LILFEQFAKKGISYLNEIQEQHLRDNFSDYLSIDVSNCSLNYDKSSSQISQWISNRKFSNNCGNQLILNFRPSVNPLTNLAFLNELRNSFRSVWVQQIDNRFIVRLVDLNERIKLMKIAELEQEVVINQMIGFSQVFKLLVEARKPIVGHNMIMDLLLMYNQFYRPLPSKTSNKLYFEDYFFCN